MTAIFHAMQTGTLATWLSVVGFGVVGWWGQQTDPARVVPVVASEIRLAEPEVVLGVEAAADSAEVPTEEVAVPEALPTPPELAVTPLPEIPELPAETARIEPTTAAIAELPARKPTAASKPSASIRPRESGPGAASSGRASTQGMAEGARLAAGRMPAPSYPEAARRAGQTGTVVVAFTVDTTGRVISAQATSPSSWPLLNEEAVRTVRRWKFPPGGVMNIQRPIVFQLR